MIDPPGDGNRQKDQNDQETRVGDTQYPGKPLATAASNKPVPTNLQPDARVQALLSTVGELIKDRAFRGALDALSCEVFDLCDGFFHEHAKEIMANCPDADPSLVISAVVGWILGMPAGAMAGDIEAKLQENYQHNLVAAVVSSFSMENSRRVFGRRQQ